MNPTPLAVAFVRYRGELLVQTGRDELPAQSGRKECSTPAETSSTTTEKLAVPTGSTGDSPDEMAQTAIRDGTPLGRDDVSLVRAGEPFDASEPSDGDWRNGLTVDAPVRFYPFLFECVAAPDFETDSTEFDWVSPVVLRGLSTSLWRAYDRVRPTVETVESDTAHGSTTLSVRALEVLRDEATLVAAGESAYTGIEAVGEALVTARPSMAAVSNRVHRAMSAAGTPPDPKRVAAVAHNEIERAITADRDAAARVADTYVDGARVATLSRSGTVLTALETGSPEAVLVAESRPGGEGVAVAEQVSEMAATTLTSDAAFPGRLPEWGADVLIVGADSMLADGRAVNKVGTHAAAAVATAHGIEVVVAAAVDKISPKTTFDPEDRDASELYEGARPVAVDTPTFEAIPPQFLDAVVTERGVLDIEAVRDIASDHATRFAWLDE